MAKKNPPIIALITDFGSKDWYTGSIKGKIHSFYPEAIIEDISNEIPPGNIHAASYILAACIDDFPPETMFLVVVDPGVGTERKAIIGRIGKQTIICPNNGIISHAIAKHGYDKGPFYEILPEHTPIDTISTTFHGRDVFAPIAGKIASGSMKVEELGDIINEVELIPIQKPEIKKRAIGGIIDYIDHYGNLITNISINELNYFSIKSSAILVIGKQTIALKKAFGEVSVGEPLTYIGSNGFIEIAVNKGNASSEMSIEIGAQIQFYPEGKED